MKWEKFAKIVVGEKTQTITLAEIVYFQTLKSERYGIVRTIISRAVTM